MKITKRKAGRDLYEVGLYTPDESRKSGYRHDRSKPSDEHDKVVAKKGEHYYMWSLYGDKKPRISTNHPTRSQLTKSEFKLEVYSIEDLLLNLKPGRSFIESLESILARLNKLTDALVDKRNNIPIQFKNNKPRKLLEERIVLVNDWLYNINKLSEHYNLKIVEQQIVLIEKLKEITYSNVYNAF